MRAIKHTHVGYKLIADIIGLLSRDNRIYAASLRHEQAILHLYTPYSAIL